MMIITRKNTQKFKVVCDYKLKWLTACFFYFILFFLNGTKWNICHILPKMNLKHLCFPLYIDKVSSFFSPFIPQNLFSFFLFSSFCIDKNPKLEKENFFAFFFEEKRKLKEMKVYQRKKKKGKMLCVKTFCHVFMATLFVNFLRGKLYIFFLSFRCAGKFLQHFNSWKTSRKFYS